MSGTTHADRSRAWLAEQIAQLGALTNGTSRDPAFKAWRQATLTVVQRVWPTDASRQDRFRRIRFTTTEPKADARKGSETFKAACSQASALLREWIDEIARDGVPEPQRAAPRRGADQDLGDDVPTLDLDASTGAAGGDAIGGQDEIMLDLGGPTSAVTAEPDAADRGPAPPSLRVKLPAKGAEPRKPARAAAEKPAAPAKPVAPAPVKPAEPAAPAANVKPAAPAKPVAPAAPAASAKPATPAKPAESARPVAPAPPAASAKPVEPVKPVAPAAPAASAKPAEPAKPVAPAAPAASAKPAEPVKPVAPAPPAASAKPVEPAPPASNAKPAAPVQPVESEKPATPTPRPAAPSVIAPLRDLLGLDEVEERLRRRAEAAAAEPPAAASAPPEPVRPAPVAPSAPEAVVPASADAPPEPAPVLRIVEAGPVAPTAEPVAREEDPPTPEPLDADAFSNAADDELSGAEDDDGPDPVAFEAAAREFMFSSPVLSAQGRPVQRTAESPDFEHPDALAIASLASDAVKLGVPEGQRATARALLVDLARCLEDGDPSWETLRDAVNWSMSHRELARRLLPVLLPWLDRAA